MKSGDCLECCECGKQLRKKVCFLKIENEILSDEDGYREYDFCSKSCGLRWLKRWTTFVFFDVELIRESRE